MASTWGRKESIITPPTVPALTFASFAGAILCTCFFIWQRLAFSLTPLQRSYITEYVRASVGARFHQSGDYRLIYLDGPKKIRPRRALPVDFEEGKTILANGKTVPVQLTVLPLSQGYRWFGRGLPERLQDASLYRWLRLTFFEDQALPRLFMVSLIEGGVCFLVMLYFAVPADIKRLKVLKYGRVLRGPVMMTPAEFDRAMQEESDRGIFRRWRAWRHIPNPNQGEHLGIGFKTTELNRMMRIPLRKEAQHFQLMGDTGAGKTTLIMQILRQIRDRGDVAIVYDPASEFIQRFYEKERGDVILNPLDSRCPFWSPAMEMETNHEATTIAESLYQPAGGSNSTNKEFFYRTPAQIFAHLLKEGPTPHVLAQWMADESFLQEKVKGTEMAFYIDRSAGPQAAGVLASLGLVAQSLRLLPKREETTSIWNATDWAKERKGWIFITSKLAQREVLRPLISLWIDILVMRLMAIPKPGQKQVWFVIDELASLQKLPQLHTAMTESRKSKNPLVIGFQGRAQLEDIYGKLAEVMLSQPATKIFMKTTEAKAAEWISETIGKVEIERLKETHFDGTRSGKNFTTDRQIEPLVMASEIAGLDDRRAYLKLGNRVARFDFEYIDSPCETPAFVPRSNPEDKLRFDRNTLLPHPPHNGPVATPKVERDAVQEAAEAATPGQKGGAQQRRGIRVASLMQPAPSSAVAIPLPSSIQASLDDFIEGLEQYRETLDAEGRGFTEKEKTAIREGWSDLVGQAQTAQEESAGEPIVLPDLESLLRSRHDGNQMSFSLE